MAISKVKVPEDCHRLMMAIGETIRQQTVGTAVSHENIVGVLAFCTGAALARDSKGRQHRRQLKEMAEANIDLGIQAITSETAPSIILPEHMH